MIRTSLRRGSGRTKCQHVVDKQEVKEIAHVMEQLAKEITVADFAEAKHTLLIEGKCDKDAFFCLSGVWYCQAHYSDHLKSPEYKKRMERAINNTIRVAKEFTKSSAAADHAARQLQLDKLFAKDETPKIVARIKGADGFHNGKKVGEDEQSQVG